MDDLMNRCCPTCLMPFAHGQLVVQDVTYRPSVRIGQDASVRRFVNPVTVTFCQGHEPAA